MATNKEIEMIKLRPSWDEYFMEVMEAVSRRGTCNRGRCGCVYVLNNQILATGYAGAPPGFQHCDEIGHEMEERVRFIQVKEKLHIAGVSKEILEIDAAKQVNIYDNIPTGYVHNRLTNRFEMLASQHCIRTIHAEQNGIIQAARRGVSLEGSTLYVGMTPCRTCTMFLISVGIKRIVCKQKYHEGEESEIMLRDSNIDLLFLSDEILKY